MGTSAPRVIACLPAYNAEKFIERTLESLKNQTYPNFNVLFSDDCSSDNTVNVIEHFIKDDERFRLIQQEKNLGWVDNINSLMDKAVVMGEYVFIMPHDDTIDPQYIQKLIAPLQKNSAAVITFSDMECTHADGKTEKLQYHHLQNANKRIKRAEKILKLKGPGWIAYRGLTRSSAVKKIIPLKKNRIGTREFFLDWTWLLKLSLIGEFIRVPEELYFKFYRKDSASISWKFNNRNFISNYLNCSIILWQWPLQLREQVRLQLIIYAIIAQRIVKGIVNSVQRRN